MPYKREKQPNGLYFVYEEETGGITNRNMTLPEAKSHTKALEDIDSSLATPVEPAAMPSRAERRERLDRKMRR